MSTQQITTIMLAYDAVMLVHRLAAELDSYYVLWEKHGRVPVTTFDKGVRAKTDKLKRVGLKALARMHRRVDAMNAEHRAGG